MRWKTRQCVNCTRRCSVKAYKLSKDEYLDYAPSDVGSVVRRNHTSSYCSGSSSSLMIRRTHDGVLAVCYRCGAKGFHSGKPAKRFFKVDVEKHYKTRGNLPSDCTEDYMDWPVEAKQMILKTKVSLADIKGTGIYYSPSLRRLLFAVSNHGDHIGFTSKAVFPDDERRYLSILRDNKRGYEVSLGARHREYIVVVEDKLSAVRLNTLGYDTLCLFGTELSVTAAMYVSNMHKGEALIMLDNDNKIVRKKARGMKTMFNNLGIKAVVCKNTDDPKYLNADEIESLVHDSIDKKGEAE